MHLFHQKVGFSIQTVAFSLNLNLWSGVPRVHRPLEELCLSVALPSLLLPTPPRPQTAENLSETCAPSEYKTRNFLN